MQKPVNIYTVQKNLIKLNRLIHGYRYEIQDSINNWHLVKICNSNNHWKYLVMDETIHVIDSMISVLIKDKTLM